MESGIGGIEDGMVVEVESEEVISIVLNFVAMQPY